MDWGRFDLLPSITICYYEQFVTFSWLGFKAEIIYESDEEVTKQEQIVAKLKKEREESLAFETDITPEMLLEHGYEKGEYETANMKAAPLYAKLDFFYGITFMFHPDNMHITQVQICKAGDNVILRRNITKEHVNEMLTVLHMQDELL